MVEPGNDGENYMSQPVEDHQVRFDSSLPAAEHDAFAIHISITDPVVKDGGMNKYVLYTIKGTDKDGPFEAFRRYSDFYHLREVLLQRWPGCYIPPIPPKKALGNKEAKFIEDRRKELENFCVKIAAIKHIFYSDEFRVFLKANATDVEKNLNALPKQSYETLIEKYQINFKMLSGREINTELVLKITSFETFLRRVKAMMDNFKQMAKNTAVARKQFCDKFNTFSGYLMPEYEKNCLVEYTGGGDDRLIFGNTNDTKLNTIINAIKDSNAKNAYDMIQDKIKTELKEISAFLDSLNGKKNYETLKEKAQQKQKEQQLELQKVLAGKTTMKTLFTRGSKEDTIANLEKAISATTKEVENLQFICDIITVILGYIEIDKFKAEKQQIYYSLMKSVCDFEINYSRGMLELWTYVSQNPNLVLND